MTRPFKAAPAAAIAATALSLGACGHNPYGMQASLGDRECLARVMYFESNRSSDEGMLAVGTVVMNRLQSSRYPKTICGVVGQQNQFADGALSKPVGGRSYARALQVADAVIGGERHDKVGGAMFFHTAGYTYPYWNMAYVVAAGGNVFYEKRTPGTFDPIHPTVLASRANDARLVGTKPVRLAAVREEDDPPARPRREPARFTPLPEYASTPPRHVAPTRVAAAEETPLPTRRGKPIRAAVPDDDDEAPAPRQPMRRTAEPVSERPVRREREPMVIASVGQTPQRREKAPPSIAELIDLDMERPQKRR